MDFLSLSELTVTKICLAIRVREGTPVHKNRPSHGLAWRIGGEAEYRFDNGRTFTAHDGTLIYLPRGSSYTVYTREAGETWAINFEVDQDAEYAPFAFEMRQAAVSDAFLQAERAWTQRSAGYDATCRAAVYTILSALCRERERAYLPSERVRTVTLAERYLSQHYTDAELRMADVAAACGVSEVYLRRLFSERMQCTPQEYLRVRRMRRAKELILSGACRMREAAEQSGFGDYSYFCRAFRRETGLSPSDYAAFENGENGIEF
ncbi:MAG: helix-turn-helix transcriptional regulator [Clostridia bacterium]|nr:helix-turn-helix transcriptional regulator [Clostridia bacterium]